MAIFPRQLVRLLSVAWLAMAVTFAVSSPSTTAAHESTLEVTVERFYGPTDTLLRLTDAGSLLAFEGSSLVLSRETVSRLDRETVQSLFARAKSLNGIRPRQESVEAEFHAYRVAVDHRLIVSTPAALAAPEVVQFVTAMLAVATRGQAQQPAECMLEARRTEAPPEPQPAMLSLATLKGGVQAVIKDATAGDYEIRPITRSLHGALANASGGRNAFFVVREDKSRYWLKLWSPSPGVACRD